MRILHVIQSLDPADGGLPKAAIGLACAQAGLGDTVAVLSHTPPDQDAAVEKAFGWMPAFDQVERLHVDPRVALETFHCRAAAARLRDWRPDVVQIHGVWMPLMRHMGRECHKGGIPYTVTLHGMFHPSLHRQKRWMKSLLWHGLGWKHLIRNASWIQALNPDEARSLAELHLRPRIHIHPNGVFPCELSPCGPGASGMTVHTGTQPTVLFLGRLHPSKGVELLLESFILASDRIPHHLVLAGPDGGLGSRLRRRAQEAGVSERVHFPGPVYGEEKRGLLRRGGMFALTSPSEGFSQSISEAAAAGMAIVMTTGCHFAGLAEAGGAVECAVDPAAVAAALVEVAESPARREAMGACAQAFMEREYTWAHIARRMREDLLPLANRHGAG